MFEQVAFFNESVNDTFLFYSLNGTGYSQSVNLAVSALATSPTFSAPYFKATDINGIVDACGMVPTGMSATGHFQRADLTTYTVSGFSFIGSHPPHR